MGMKPSALQSAIDRNLTVKTLRQISEAARIPIAEFFIDELSDEEKQSLLVSLQPAHLEQQEQESGDRHLGFVVKPAFPPPTPPKKDELPFGNDNPSASQKPDLTADVAFICPHCHEAIKLGFVK
jgi:hypothetical protein